MESDQSIFHDLQNSGNRWSNYFRQNPERLSYGLLALLYILILALFITVFSNSSSSGNLQLVSKKEINDFNSKVSKLSSEMDRLQSTFIKKKCQDDWIQFENSCYYISKTRFDWTAARTMCQNKESDLLVINNAKEQLFISGKTNPSSYKRFWLGMHDTDEEGLWKWVDETNYETSYKFWTKGEPNDHDGEEDCALLWNNGEWNDVPCSYDSSYAVCEKKL
ncbi:hepatic lectin-like isoform X2 [Rana temporaria]|uniref:hepatic lectin-like isoform X2 n=1 Tax=Rana temporaria TaxID=8407 RepID=UPI001AAC9AC1|nr:hepatic lectin-like isoform X2 [Rana temporaria]